MQRRLILFGAVLVWLLFAASFLMPVIKGDDMAGWQAFWMYVTEIWDVPNYWRQIQREPSAILVSTFPSTNGLVFIAPVVLFRWPRWSGWLGGFLTFGGLVPVFGFFGMVIDNQLRVGFYCWVISIFLMALLCLLDWTRQRRIRRRES
ncbi:MAG TPA: hypothetical protein VNT99_19040 [Methylomirabilota bacterium]|nr:hypothetical protein [Methylomirabilota bacterium]